MRKLLGKLKYIDERKNRTQTSGKIFGSHGSEELILLKWPFLHRAVYKFNAIPIIIPIFHKAKSDDHMDHSLV